MFLKSSFLMRFLISNFIIAVVFFSQPLAITQPEFTQKILAVVNGEVITQTDVDELLAPIYIQYKSTYKGEELEEKLKIAKNDILSQLIEDKLILQEARAAQLKVDEKEVVKLIAELKNNFETIDEFETILKNRNVTLNDLRNRYEQQLLIKKIIARKVLSKITISPAKISEYYELNKQNFKIPEQVKLRSIFLNINDNVEEVINKANEIYAQLQKGVEFIELVEKYSEAPNVVNSGDMGYMKKGSLRGEIEEAVFKIKSGEFTPPIKTASGFYLFKVEDKKTETVSAFEDVQDEIRNLLYNKEVEIKLNEWIEKLKKDAFIEVKTDEK
ncbi:MAG: peptidylprolyl isomerase [Candidatus Omnitrophota bacterium]